LALDLAGASAAIDAAQNAAHAKAATIRKILLVRI
jgi:hypothetical protein